MDRVSSASSRIGGSRHALDRRTRRVSAVYGGAVSESDSTTCPICGKGTLRTVDFGDQQPESREVQTFTCGHEVKGGRLRTADADRLDVERRQSEETVTPVDPEE